MSDAIKMSGWEVRRSEVIASQGMVTAKRPAVAKIGLDVLQRGGNAIDAAVAMAFAIDVAEPPMTGIGGGGFMTVALANGESYVVDFFPRAPGGATHDMYELTPEFKADKLGFSGVKDNANTVGHRSVGIPGNVAGPLLALERWGTMGRAEILAPAVEMARKGTEITWWEMMATAHAASILKRNPEAARLYLNNGNPQVPGMDKPVYIRFPELAATLEKISSDGAEAFYQGEVAEKMVEELQKGGLPTSLADFASYKPLVKEPLKTQYRGLEFLLLPQATGGPTVAEILHLLEGWDLSGFGHNSAEYLHRLIEACKLALADRLVYLAEPSDTSPYIPWVELASAEYAAQRRHLITDKALGVYPPGQPPMTAPSTPYHPSAENCTTFLSAWDKDGNAVALTQTLTGYYGSGVAVPGTGVILNNAMVLFDPRPSQLNSVAPNKRPLSSMSHFIARRPEDGSLVCLAGAPGGRKIVDTVTQVLLNMVDFGMTAQQACGSPFIDPVGDETLIDNLVGEATIQRLLKMGHKLSSQIATFWPGLSARPNAIKREGGLLYGGADLYSAGVAAGY